MLNRLGEWLMERPHRSPEDMLLNVAVGFVAWFVLNSIVSILPGMGLCLGYPMNIGIVGYMLYKRRGYFTFGYVAAFALNLLISMVLGLLFNAVCFGQPFYIGKLYAPQ